MGTSLASALHTHSNVKHPRLAPSATSQEAIGEFVAGKADAAAGVKNTLMANAERNSDLRVIEGNFMVIGQASGVPRAREASARYLREFIEEAKASGFVARALQKSGVADATVAPPAGK